MHIYLKVCAFIIKPAKNITHCGINQLLNHMHKTKSTNISLKFNLDLAE